MYKDVIIIIFLCYYVRSNHLSDKKNHKAELRCKFLNLSSASTAVAFCIRAYCILDGSFARIKNKNKIK